MLTLLHIHAIAQELLRLGVDLSIRQIHPVLRPSLHFTALEISRFDFNMSESDPAASCAQLRQLAATPGLSANLVLTLSLLADHLHGDWYDSSKNDSSDVLATAYALIQQEAALSRTRAELHLAQAQVLDLIAEQKDDTISASARHDLDTARQQVASLQQQLASKIDEQFVLHAASVRDENEQLRKDKLSLQRQVLALQEQLAASQAASGERAAPTPEAGQDTHLRRVRAVE